MREIERDFGDLLALFNAHKVECLIVRAYALALHGAPRHTGDLDVFVRPDAANARASSMPSPSSETSTPSGGRKTLPTLKQSAKMDSAKRTPRPRNDENATLARGLEVRA